MKIIFRSFSVNSFETLRIFERKVIRPSVTLFQKYNSKVVTRMLNLGWPLYLSKPWGRVLFNVGIRLWSNTVPLPFMFLNRRLNINGTQAEGLISYFENIWTFSYLVFWRKLSAPTTQIEWNFVSFRMMFIQLRILTTDFDWFRRVCSTDSLDKSRFK